MCRLFGLHAGRAPVSATFWLLDAPDSLAAQTHRNPDGAGIGVFAPDGSPHITKQPIAASTEFAEGPATLAYNDDTAATPSTRTAPQGSSRTATTASTRTALSASTA